MKRYSLYISGKELATIGGFSLRTAYRHFKKIRVRNGLGIYAKITSVQVAEYLEISLEELYKRL